MEESSELNEFFLTIVKTINNLNKNLNLYENGKKSETDKLSLLEIRKIINKEYKSISEICKIKTSFPSKIVTSFLTLLIKYEYLYRNLIISDDIYLKNDLENIKTIVKNVNISFKASEESQLAVKIISSQLKLFFLIKNDKSNQSDKDLIYIIMEIIYSIIDKLDCQMRYYNTPKVISSFIEYAIQYKITSRKIINIIILIIQCSMNQYLTLNTNDLPRFDHNLDNFLKFIFVFIDYIIISYLKSDINIENYNISNEFIFNIVTLITKSKFEQEKKPDDENFLFVYERELVHLLYDYFPNIDMYLKIRKLFNFAMCVNYTHVDKENEKESVYKDMFFIKDFNEKFLLPINNVFFNKIKENVNEKDENQKIDFLSIEELFIYINLYSIHQIVKTKSLNPLIDYSQSYKIVNFLLSQMRKDYIPSSLIDNIIEDIISNIVKCFIFNKHQVFDIITAYDMKQITIGLIENEYLSNKVKSNIEKSLLMSKINTQIKSFSNNPSSHKYIDYDNLNDILTCLSRFDYFFEKVVFHFFNFSNSFFEDLETNENENDEGNFNLEAKEPYGDNKKYEIEFIFQSLMSFSQFCILLYFSFQLNSNKTQGFSLTSFNYLNEIYINWNDFLIVLTNSIKESKTIKQSTEYKDLLFIHKTSSICILFLIEIISYINLANNYLSKQEINTYISKTLIYFSNKESITKISSINSLVNLYKTNNFHDLSVKINKSLILFMTSILNEIPYNPEESLSRLSSLIEIGNLSQNQIFFEEFNFFLTKNKNILFFTLDSSIMNKDFNLIRYYLMFYQYFTSIYILNNEKNENSLIQNNIKNLKYGNVFRVLILKIIPLVFVNKLIYPILNIINNLIYVLHELQLEREEAENFSSEDAENVSIKSGLNVVLYEIYDHLLHIIKNNQNFKILIETLVVFQNITQRSDFFNILRMSQIEDKLIFNIKNMVKEYSYEHQISFIIKEYTKFKITAERKIIEVIGRENLIKNQVYCDLIKKRKEFVCYVKEKFLYERKDIEVVSSLVDDINLLLD